MMLGERSHLVAEIVGIGWAAVEHHDGGAGSDLGVEKADAIDRRVA